MSFCKKVLIYPWGTKESFEIYRALHKSIHVEIIAGCIEDPGIFERLEKISAPAMKNNVDISEWENFINKNEIEYIYPVSEEARNMFFRENEFFKNIIIQSTPCKIYEVTENYTNIVKIDCFTSEDGKNLFCGAYQCIENKISSLPVPKRILRLIEDVQNKYEFVGYWNIECVLSENTCKLLRVSSEWSIGINLWCGLGVNLPLLSLYQTMGNPIYISPLSIPVVGDINRTRFKVDIEYERVYIDLDDTIIIGGKVNTQAVTFIYQCINNGIEVHLISKHKGNIHKYLEKYRLTHLFSSVIWISKDDEKYRYINPIGSILIDDAFRERIVVQKELQIPTFEVCAIEHLIHG